jgi:hypothetical protein
MIGNGNKTHLCSKKSIRNNRQIVGRLLRNSEKKLRNHGNVAEMYPNYAGDRQNHININVRRTGQGEAIHRKCNTLKIAAFFPTTDEFSDCIYRMVS